MRLAADRRLDVVLQQRLEVAGSDVGSQARAQVDGRRLADRHCRPATRSAISAAATMNTSRIRKPTVAAVAGSIRRNSAGAVNRPRSRASAQPRTTITLAAATRTGVSRPNSTSRRT